MRPRFSFAIATGFFALAFAFVVVGCGGTSASVAPGSNPLVALPGFTQTNLISDQAGVAAITDPNLINPWGIAFSGSGPWWIADNDSNFATVYSGGTPANPITNQNLNVSIQGGNPTGQVFNSTSDFQVTNGATTAKALFIFSTENGMIVGWAPSVNAGTAVTGATVANAVYKGLALGSNASGNFLFATNFHAGTIDVFDSNYQQVTLSGNFTDPGIPAGYAPFGIRNFGGTLYVTYAKQQANQHDDQAGPGNGFVDTFDTNGNFMSRVVSRGFLNSPWGLEMAPAGFGAASGKLLVGNFGDGKINVFDPANPAKPYMGTLYASATQPIAIEGIWGISLGNGGSAGSATSLYFTSGPGGESHGLFGRLDAPSGPVRRHR